MDRVERQQWMDDKWQEMHAVTEGLFAEMQAGNIEGFHREMKRMIRTMQAGLIRSTKPTQEIETPETCEFCANRTPSGICISQDRRAKSMMHVAMGSRCDAWRSR